MNRLDARLSDLVFGETEEGGMGEGYVLRFVPIRDSSNHFVGTLASILEHRSPVGEPRIVRLTRWGVAERDPLNHEAKLIKHGFMQRNGIWVHPDHPDTKPAKLAAPSSGLILPSQPDMAKLMAELGVRSSIGTPSR